MCNPGSFYVNNAEINLPTARSTKGRCELTNAFVPPFSLGNKCVNKCVNVNNPFTGAVTQQCTQVCGEVTHPGNPTGKKWAPWDPSTNYITDATFIVTLNGVLPYTPAMCQQICEQAIIGGVPSVGKSFSTTGENKIKLLNPDPEYTDIYYQCMCGVTDGNCIINTLLPDKAKWKTWDWTATAINKCTNCK